MKWTMRVAVAVMLVGLSATVLLSAANGGKLKVVTPGMILNLMVYGQKAAIPANREASLPPGEYKPVGIELYARGVDKKGRDVLWKITSSRSFGKLATISVAQGQTTEVEGGEPITVKALCSVAKKGVVKSLSIGLAYIGKSGETYSAKVYCGRSLAPAPKFQILDESGKVLDTGTFGFG